MTSTAQRLIESYGLERHPEGGYYRETHRATQRVTRDESDLELAFNRRSLSASTAILYLLEKDDFSALHRIQSDEVWHFYAGDPLRVVTLKPSGEREDFMLGANLDRGERFQACVPAARWFGAHLETNRGFCLVGCTVAPGFEFADFELGTRSKLLEMYPQHAAIVQALTRR
ncbi:MAG: cupin domain-containing protein [Polyangiaceae bacterium]